MDADTTPSESAASQPVQTGEVASSEKKVTTPKQELDTFVRDRREDAFTYLKLLKEEIAKAELTRTRHAYICWTLVIAFFLLNSNLGQLHLFGFEKLDRSLLLKSIPAAIAMAFYVTLSRQFVLRELGGISFELGERLFPGENFPFYEYIQGGSFMRAERLLNLARPAEQLSTIFMLGLIVTVVAWGPLAACLYGYFVLLSEYGIGDDVVRVSVIVGLAFLAQAMVIESGNRALVRQDMGGARLIFRRRDA